MFSYWSQLLIPLYNHFYKQHVSAWLGNLKKIFVVLCLFVGCVILFNYINNVALGYKAVISLLVLMLFGGVYSLKNLYKVL